MRRHSWPQKERRADDRCLRCHYRYGDIKAAYYRWRRGDDRVRQDLCLP